MWQVAEAKNKFSEFLSKAEGEGPQRVTRQGKTYVLLAEEAYQNLFKKQVAIFEETMAEAQKHMKALDTTKLDSETAKAQAELARAAFEKALTNMQILAESAQKANTEAYEIVSARIQESMAELREMAQNLKVGGSAVDEDDLAGLHEIGRGLADGALRAHLELVFVVIARLGAQPPGQDRTAVGAFEDALGFHPSHVTTDRRLRGAELLAQVGDTHRAYLDQPVVDPLPTLLGYHDVPACWFTTAA
jgi:phasin family protein